MDSAEIEIVAKKYLDSVYRVAINYSKNVQDAGDAVQNAFLKLIKNNLVFSDEEHIHRWLIKVTINECKSVWRKRSRHPISSLDELYDTGYELPAGTAIYVTFENGEKKKIEVHDQEKDFSAGLVLVTPLPEK